LGAANDCYRQRIAHAISGHQSAPTDTFIALRTRPSSGSTIGARNLTAVIVLAARHWYCNRANVDLLAKIAAPLRQIIAPALSFLRRWLKKPARNADWHGYPRLTGSRVTKY